MPKRITKIRIKSHFRKMRTKRGRKQVLIRRHNRRVLKNLGSAFELKVVHRIPGRKTQLLQLREDIEENLFVPDIQEERRAELQGRLAEINQQLKRITGRPPSEDVTGRFPSEMKLSLLERFKGTSSRRPQFVEEMNLPLKEIMPPIREEQRRRAREQFGFKKGLDVLEEKAIEKVIKGTTPPLSLKEIKKKRNFGSLNISDIDQIKQKVLSGEKQTFVDLEDGKEGLILATKYSPEWWKKVTKDDIERVTVR